MIFPLSSFELIASKANKVLRELSIKICFGGEIKIFVLAVDGGGDARITPSSLLGANTYIDMQDAGDTVILVYTGSAWACLSATGHDGSNLSFG